MTTLTAPLPAAVRTQAASARVELERRLYLRSFRFLTARNSEEARVYHRQCREALEAVEASSTKQAFANERASA